MTRFIISYKDAVSLGPQAVGGKGWNLGRLHRYGFAVPRGGILVANAYTQFLAEPKLQSLCAELARVQSGDGVESEITEILDTLRMCIVATPFPADVERALHTFLTDAALAETSVAVRSSATAEDSAATSFAGVHESFLGVKGHEEVVRAIKGCYASLWTPRAVAYRRQQGLADDDVACAVVICAMVTGPKQTPPAAAGVAFSCDPRTGQRDRVTINAAPGWGEAVVSGTVSPEAITVVQRADGELLRIERAQGQEQVLTDDQAAVLASLVRRVLWALGDGQEQQDVEWTYDGEQFWLVQARPVTHLPRVTFPAVAALPTIWSNANLKDAVTGVQTPLSWSIVQLTVDAILYAPYRTIGYRLPEGMELIRRFRGRAYFDLTAMQWVSYDAFGLLPHEFNQSLGGHQPEIPVPSQHPLRGWSGLRRRRAQLRLLRASTRNARTLPGEIERVRAEARTYAHLPLIDLSCADLFALLQQLLDRGQAFGARFQLANLSGIWEQVLAHLLERERPGQGQALAAALMAGSREVVSAEQGYRLYDVAAAAAYDPAARTYLAVAPLDPQGWRSLPEHSPFRQALAAFLDDFGHRGVYETELANPRWNEDPAYLLDAVRALLAQHSLEAPFDVAQQKRQAAQAEVAHLPTWLRPLVSWLAERARRAAAQREAGKSTMVALLEPLRQIVLEIGRRMVESDVLDKQGEVFFLTWYDLVAFLQGQWDGRGARALVADRQAQRHRWLAKTPPDSFICDSQGRPAELPSAAEQEGMPVAHQVGGQVSRNARELHGVAASSGQATGRARIIRHPSEGHLLQAGEVLVAPSTDPGWTPLFLRACAVVMETGGYLSHGAIVAREFGLPAVVNIPGLLEIVQDGQSVMIDGNRGCILLDGVGEQGD
ncbi:MAG TPA: PEP/pyruvate-binding domain-containing protein [Ktedonobacteraceae bacterium]|nr:PEP/pyruvate-binding domain-containing protein [Ktedonobacteraceae bacterium]